MCVCVCVSDRKEADVTHGKNPKASKSKIGLLYLLSF